MTRFELGRFELLRQVGEGGAGVVFEARDLHTQSTVAIKLLHTGNELALTRFEREIAVLAELPHPAIVRYIAHGRADDGRHYLVMEWLAGKTVDEHRRGQWPVSEVLTLARRVVSGLAFAAQRGVSHRDIKPANLFLVGAEVSNAKILDFGLAQRLSDGLEVARSGSVVGTPLYMSPEQARGDDLLDARTDVFSLGSVLYTCLCGRAPFLAPQAVAILSQICSDEPLPIEERAPHVPMRLRVLVQAMMRKEREERPAWRAIAEELGAIADQHVELQVAPPSHIESSSRQRPVSLTPGAAQSFQRRYRIMVGVFVARPQAMSEKHEAELSEVAARYSASIELQEDGTRMLLPKQQLDATEQALVAARCALSLLPVLSGRAPIVVCTGRVALGDARPFAELIERAASLLSGAPASAVHVDAPSAALLEARFEFGVAWSSKAHAAHSSENAAEAQLRAPSWGRRAASWVASVS